MKRVLRAALVVLLGTGLTAPAFAQSSLAMLTVSRATGGQWANNLGRHPEAAFPCLQKHEAAARQTNPSIAEREAYRPPKATTRQDK